MRWSLAGLFACGLPVACADPCIDDGLGQQGQGSCPQASASQTEGATDSNTETVSDTMGSATMGSNTEAMTDSRTGTDTVETLDGTVTVGTLDATDTDTDTMGATETAGGTLWCVDADGDGFGDPDMCQQSDEPVPGSVDNDDDCDDSSETTFPGAAPNDDRRACMRDEDGDDWGDDNSGGDLPPGVEPGTDCLDDDSAIFPGTAENETPPDLCARDEDHDGWGDPDPPPGADPGTDCDDTNPEIRPGAAENEPDLCAEDEDDDGWGDTNPPPGVDPGSDCDDGNVYTFPGAAPLDDPNACMQDEDDDDFGDDNGNGMLPPGVVPGTDCDDTNPNAFPGAAPNENPPDLCTIDEDGDGWGDANPPGGGGGGGGPQGGSDCFDANPQLNPDTLQLSAFMPFNAGPATQRTLQTVNPATAALGPFIDLEDAMGNNPDINLVTATMDATGLIFANDLDGAEVYTVEYEDTCDMGTGLATGLGGYGAPAIVCGLEFGGDGMLYAIDNDVGLTTFDPVTGQPIATIDIVDAGGVELNVNSCGMAYDCAQDRLLLANGGDLSIYSIDPVTGVFTLLRDLDPFFGPAWTPVGLAWDPISRMVYLSTGPDLYMVDIDDVAAAPVLIGGFGGPIVSNLGYMPICI